MVAPAAVAVAADKSKRRASIEPMREGEACTVFTEKCRGSNLPSRAPRHRWHWRAWSCHGRGDAAARLTIVVVDLRLQPIDLRAHALHALGYLLRRETGRRQVAVGVGGDE